MASVEEAEVAPRSPWSIKRTQEEQENFKPKSKLELVK